MNVLLWIIGATVVDGLAAFVGVFTLFLSDKKLKKLLIKLVAFSAGALLAGGFIHLIPEALDNLQAEIVFGFVIIGFILFFLLERFLHWHHCHDGKCDVHQVTYLILIGDGIHNFVDGVIIAVSFIVSVPFGIVSTLLILGHEVPQELGDYGILVYGGMSKTRSLMYNFIAQLTAVLGGIIGYFLSNTIQSVIPYILPFAAGGFIYIAASDLVPELHKEPDLQKSLVSFGFFLVGVIFMIAIKLIF
jgi:zinc and cadmium transporter